MLIEMKSSNYCQSLITACYGQQSNITLTEQFSVFIFQNAAKLHFKLSQNAQSNCQVEFTNCGYSAHVHVVFHVSCM